VICRPGMLNTSSPNSPYGTQFHIWMRPCAYTSHVERRCSR
jgi:hypothetical protein